MELPSVETLFDLEYFFELSPDLLCVAGFDGYFKKINPAVSKTLGYSNEELFSRPINSFVHPEDQEITNQKRDRIRENEPLQNFENRYVTKSGETVWLSWTSMPINRDQLVFAIAKDITYKKKMEEFWKISDVLGVSPLRKKRLLEERVNAHHEAGKTNLPGFFLANEIAPADQLWLLDFENIVRKFIGKIDLNLKFISNELAISERALFRRVHLMLGLTPNRLIRIIRLQVAWEAIGTGKYRTIAEISVIAGFKSPAYFGKLFEEVYGIPVLDLLK